jgi:hypothetical protein
MSGAPAPREARNDKGTSIGQLPRDSARAVGERGGCCHGRPWRGDRERRAFGSRTPRKKANDTKERLPWSTGPRHWMATLVTSDPPEVAPCPRSRCPAGSPGTGVFSGNSIAGVGGARAARILAKVLPGTALAHTKGSGEKTLTCPFRTTFARMQVTVRCPTRCPARPGRCPGR